MIRECEVAMVRGAMARVVRSVTGSVIWVWYYVVMETEVLGRAAGTCAVPWGLWPTDIEERRERREMVGMDKIIESGA
ncbi:MAG TPA: hypothetical protein DDZ84_00085 [Firmicutes bacterium]|nr:hypothetical protein [Bacillota bacterium]